MMRVLVLGLSDNIGGIETFFHAYYKKFNLNEITFDFATVCDHIAFDDDYKDNGAKIFTLPHFIKHPFKYYSSLCKIIRENNYDVIYVNMLSAANILPLLAAKKQETNLTIAHSHNSGLPKGVSRKILHFLNKPFLKRGNILKVACGKDAGEWLFGKKTDFVVINNAIDADKFVFDNKLRKEIRKHYDVKDTEFLLGNVGRLCEQKNQIFLIDILAELNKYNNFKLMLIGAGDKKTEILRKAKRDGVTDRLIIIDNTSDIYKYYNAFDVFVFPSLFEGLPVAPIEAQANGLPCLLSSLITVDVNQGDAIFCPLDRQEWINKILEMSNITTRSMNLKDDYNIDNQYHKLLKICSQGAAHGK